MELSSKCVEYFIPSGTVESIASLRSIKYLTSDGKNTNENKCIMMFQKQQDNEKWNFVKILFGDKMGSRIANSISDEQLPYLPIFESKSTENKFKFLNDPDSDEKKIMYVLTYGEKTDMSEPNHLYMANQEEINKYYDSVVSDNKNVFAYVLEYNTEYPDGKQIKFWAKTVSE